jgi:acetoin utilization deacetylase AcuC-like enzyme
MQADGRVRKILILDCDVHQGDATAAILARDPSVFTFSIRAAKNFPYRKVPSDLDVALPDATADRAYLMALAEGLEKALRRADAGLAIYLAGADPCLEDRLGHLALSEAGLLKRDRLLFQACREAGLPVAVTLSGGYAREQDDTVEIHFNTMREASQIFAAR